MEKSIEKKYNYWQWRTLIILMIGYALFYFVRKNFSIAMPTLEAELGFSKKQLGIFLTLNGVIYGVSRFVNGLISDKTSRKKLLMATGLLLSAIVNVIIGFLPMMNSFFNVLDAEGKATMAFVYILGSLWLINGYIQGMGYPPCSSLMVNWIKPSELATKQSIWNASHSIGAGLLAFMIGAILGHFGNEAWQWCFFAPAILAIFGAAMIFFGLKDTPESIGLPNVEAMESGKVEIKETEIEDPDVTALAYKKCVNKLVFGNPIIWLLSIADFFVYIIRFTILDWGSTILTQFKGMDISLAASVVGACEIIGGIAGMLVAGWVTDRFFKSKAHCTSAICTLGATLCLLFFWKAPQDNAFLCIACIVMSAFFIYGPQALLGIAASNQATRRAAATANGLMGMFCYLAPIVSGVVFGALAENRGWDSVMLVSVIFGFLGAALLGVLWNKPANGYEKAEKIMEEVHQELGK